VFDVERILTATLSFAPAAPGGSDAYVVINLPAGETRDPDPIFSTVVPVDPADIHFFTFRFVGGVPGVDVPPWAAYTNTRSVALQYYSTAPGPIDCNVRLFFGDSDYIVTTYWETS
jgi:hypothetical protein